MLPLQPSLADDYHQELLEFLAANNLPDNYSPDREDIESWWLID